ncbi:MAG: preprotein translocase subunit SecG [Verrucomicrobiota bacterium]
MFWVNLTIYTLLAIYVIICVLMVLVILMQRSKQDGLGAAFGGGMMDSAFGPSTSNVLVKSTVGLAVIYFCITLTLAWLYAFSTGVNVNAAAVETGNELSLEQIEAEVGESAAQDSAAAADKATAAGSPIVNESEAVSDPVKEAEDLPPPEPSSSARPAAQDLPPEQIPPGSTPAQE